MNKFKMEEQAVPGSIGGAISVIWITYGDWFGWVPPELSDPKQFVLMGAIAVVATTIVNFVRHYTTRKDS